MTTTAPPLTPTLTPARDALLRLNDFYEVYQQPDAAAAQAESSRCMSCGAPFCQPSGGYGAGCPLDNRIPEWNELVQHGRWREAYQRLRLTNNFPEFTSRACPAPCQDACIHGINGDPVAIKSIERVITDRAFDEGFIRPHPPARRTGKAVAIIGSGPAGLAAADQLNQMGHHVAIFEKDDRPGGLLMYGVPNMKLDKRLVHRRIQLLAAEGVRFCTNSEVGRDVDPAHLRRHYDAVLLACGAQQPRELALPGRDLPGIHPAMDYLTAATRQHLEGELPDPTLQPLHARGKDVLIIGGGDTGADCIATALRQHCRSVINITRRERPPHQRDDDHPWPGPPGTFEIDYAHAEAIARFGADPRAFALQPIAFESDQAGHIRAVRVQPVDRTGSRREPAGPPRCLPAQLVLIAAGFTGHAATPLLQAFGTRSLPTQGSTVADAFHTDVDGVFTAGDMRRGPSLIVWAIAEGRGAADAVEAHLRTAH